MSYTLDYSKMMMPAACHAWYRTHWWHLSSIFAPSGPVYLGDHILSAMKSDGDQASGTEEHLCLFSHQNLILLPACHCVQSQPHLYKIEIMSIIREIKHQTCTCEMHTDECFLSSKRMTRHPKPCGDPFCQGQHQHVKVVMVSMVFWGVIKMQEEDHKKVPDGIYVNSQLLL